MQIKDNWRNLKSMKILIAVLILLGALLFLVAGLVGDKTSSAIGFVVIVIGIVDFILVIFISNYFKKHCKEASNDSQS